MISTNDDLLALDWSHLIDLGITTWINWICGELNFISANTVVILAAGNCSESVAFLSSLSWEEADLSVLVNLPNWISFIFREYLSISHFHILLSAAMGTLEFPPGWIIAVWVVSVDFELSPVDLVVVWRISVAIIVPPVLFEMPFVERTVDDFLLPLVGLTSMEGLIAKLDSETVVVKMLFVQVTIMSVVLSCVVRWSLAITMVNMLVVVTMIAEVIAVMMMSAMLSAVLVEVFIAFLLVTMSSAMSDAFIGVSLVIVGHVGGTIAIEAIATVSVAEVLTIRCVIVASIARVTISVVAEGSSRIVMMAPVAMFKVGGVEIILIVVVITISLRFGISLSEEVVLDLPAPLVLNWVPVEVVWVLYGVMVVVLLFLIEIGIHRGAEFMHNWDTHPEWFLLHPLASWSFKKVNMLWFTVRWNIPLSMNVCIMRLIDGPSIQDDIFVILLHLSSSLSVAMIEKGLILMMVVTKRLVIWNFGSVAFLSSTTAIKSTGLP